MHFKFDAEYAHRARQGAAMVALNPALGKSGMPETACI